MLKDIEVEQVNNVGIAVVREKSEEGETIYNVYLINKKDHPIEGVLVSSKGYGEINGEKRSTSVLRHFLETVDKKSFKLIEPIVEDVFNLTNEYWISFYEDKKLLDKKFRIVPETIREDNFIEIPFIEKPGVLII
ncbi:MAG: hypothetical protein ACJAY8_001535 [Sphingobacteriales bacterium]|jgi:hypothetical protein